MLRPLTAAQRLIETGWVAIELWTYAAMLLFAGYAWGWSASRAIQETAGVDTMRDIGFKGEASGVSSI